MGLLADANLNALKDDKFWSGVIVTALIIFSAPFGWFSVIQPEIVWGFMIAAAGLRTGLPLLKVKQQEGG